MRPERHNRFNVSSGTNKQGELRQQPRTTGNTDNNTRLAYITKKYFKLIQTTHHAEILSEARQNGALPPGMKRQIYNLTSFIKPACPNTIITDKVKQTTHDWMGNILNILIEHYDTVIATLLTDLEELDLAAFDKAVGWARSRFRRKLTHSSLDTVRTLISNLNTETTSVTVTQPALTLPVRTNQRTTYAQVVRQGTPPPTTSRMARLGTPLLALPGSVGNGTSPSVIARQIRQIRQDTLHSTVPGASGPDVSPLT